LISYRELFSIFNGPSIDLMKHTMNKFKIYNSHFSCLKKAFSVCIFLCGLLTASAHQTPSTIVLLDISPAKVTAELQLPLSELELAFGHDVFTNPQNLVERVGPQLKEYLLAHIHVMEAKNKPWLVNIADMKVEEAEQAASGPPFREITVHLVFTPYPGTSTRHFLLDYDVIMHQVMNHAALVSIRNDWESGKAGGQTTEAGVIHWDMKDNVIYPLQVSLEKGSWWTGFKSMLTLGMEHIREGTDHLMFLLVLLLPATLLTGGKRWGKFGGTRYSIARLLKIVTAFTIGHSITLILGAAGWISLPSKPVEILIAFSILVSAVHAVRPIFAGKEMYIAAGFGLIHGLAFAGTLTNLHLEAAPMALSILGFNAGIEIMQLLITAITVPWLILLSKTPAYRYIRICGAVFAALAAIGWILERYTGTSNILSAAVDNTATHALRIIAVLALATLAGVVVKLVLAVKFKKA
jgi:HupE / UreJ protein